MDTSFLKAATAHELLGLYDAVLCELRERGLVRSANSPVADYAELLASRALNFELAGRSSTGFDGKCAAGIRYEVKARRRSLHNGSVRLSALRDLDKGHFDYLIGVIFRSDFRVEYALKIVSSLYSGALFLNILSQPEP